MTNILFKRSGEACFALDDKRGLQLYVDGISLCLNENEARALRNFLNHRQVKQVWGLEGKSNHKEDKTVASAVPTVQEPTQEQELARHKDYARFKELEEWSADSRIFLSDVELNELLELSKQHPEWVTYINFKFAENN